MRLILHDLPVALPQKAQIPEALALECGSSETVSKPIMERAFSPFLFCLFHIPGLRPGLVWIAPSALKLLS